MSFVKMVNYEFLKSLDNNTFLEMVRRGIIPVTIMDYLTVYEFYISELNTNSQSTAITSAADKYNCTERTIYNIINFMKK